MRLEGIGAMLAAAISAVGAVMDWPVAFGVAAILAIAVTVSYFSSKKRGRGARGASGNPTAPQNPEKPMVIHAHQV